MADQNKDKELKGEDLKKVTGGVAKQQVADNRSGSGSGGGGGETDVSDEIKLKGQSDRRH